MIQIDTNSSEFALPNGLSVQSSKDDWTAFWQEKPESYNAMMSIVFSPQLVNWKNQGFALEVPDTFRFHGVRLGPPTTQVIILLPKGQLAKSTYVWSFVGTKPIKTK